MQAPGISGIDYRSRSPTYQRISYSPPPSDIQYMHNSISRIPQYSYLPQSHYSNTHVANHSQIYSSPPRVYASPQRTFVQPNIATYSPSLHHPQLVLSPVVTYSPVHVYPQHVITAIPETIYHHPVVETHHYPA